MKKILISLITISTVAAVAIGASGAFFSDTETSVDNTFTAGAIDLQIDNSSYALDHNIPSIATPSGEFVENPDNSWTLSDLTIEKFFDFIDLKPGDYGEDTISIHVNNNDAYVCAAAQITADEDNSITEPEEEDGDDGTDQNGELDEEVNFAFWNDDGDNVYEDDETIFLQGPISGVGQQGQITLADSSTNVWTGQSGPITGDETVYIGKYFCFGSISEAAVTQDGVNTGDPIANGTGFNCDGANIDNQAQTDSVVADLEFFAVQSRNNTDFSCDEWQPSFTN